MVLVLLLSLSVARAALAALAALAAPQGVDGQPVRVWLESSQPLVPGALVHAYVRTSSPGNLIVLHRRTDGGVDVLYPTTPRQDPFTPAGTYEIVTGERGAAFAAGAVGHGMVLAALAAEPMRVMEFAASSDAWEAAAFSAPSTSPDAESQFTDAVQRMLGDGSFNYDLAAYEVVPPVYAYGYQDTTGAYPDTASAIPGACEGCTAEPWDAWVVSPSLGCVSLGCRALGGSVWTEPRAAGVWGDRAGARAVAAYRRGRANAVMGARALLSGAPRRNGMGPSWPRSETGLVARAGGSPRRPSGVGAPAPVHELPPIVIVQPRSRPASAQLTAPEPARRGFGPASSLAWRTAGRPQAPATATEPRRAAAPRVSGPGFRGGPGMGPRPAAYARAPSLSATRSSGRMGLGRVGAR